MITKRARRSKKIPTIFTIGHSTCPIAEFLTLLQEVGVDLLVDVRSIPRSRTNPQFNADALAGTFDDAGIVIDIYRLLAGCVRKRAAPRSIRSGMSPPSGTMLITRQRSFSNRIERAASALP